MRGVAAQCLVQALGGLPDGILVGLATTSRRVGRRTVV